MKEKKISVIVPVYKVEDYLECCVDSIINQTYKNLEIILVDDGSPDRCSEICDRYATNDDRVIVIHKQNEGVARARNSALDIATGDYISFIDSDDWIAEDAYEYLVKNIERYKADCVVGRCQIVYEKDGALKYAKKENVDIKCMMSSGAMKEVLNKWSAIWNRLFKKKIFDNLRFPVDRINDDEVTVLHAYAGCNRVVFLNHYTYYYRIRANSITSSTFSMRKVDVFYNAKDNMKYISEERPKLYKYAEAKFVKAGLYCMFNLLKMKTENAEAKRQKKEAIKYICQEFKKEIRSINSNKVIPTSYKIALRALTIR